MAAHQAVNTGVGCHFLLQCMKVKSESEVTQSCPTLSDPMDYSLPGSSVHGHSIIQATSIITQIFPLSTSKVHLTSSGAICLIYPMSSATPTLTLFLVSVAMKGKVLVTQLCLILCDCKDCSPPGSSVHGIFQARILEWEAIPFSRESSQPRDRTRVPCFGKWILYCLSHQERESNRHEALTAVCPGTPLACLYPSWF